MAFQNVDWEALLREDSELPPDVSFKVYDNASVVSHAQINDSDEMEAFKIFKAHKFLLAAVSETFRKQFFGSLPAPQTAEPITVEQTSSKAFGIMLNFLYQKAQQFAFPCGHFACLFEVKNLGEKYQIADLVRKTDLEISSRHLSDENLVEATVSSKSFHHLFTEISEDLVERCAAFFTKNYPSLDKVRMLLRDHKDSSLETEAIMVLIKSEPPAEERSQADHRGSEVKRHNCDRCMDKHVGKECPARKNRCMDCGKKGHFSKSPCCRDHLHQLHLNHTCDRCFDTHLQTGNCDAQCRQCEKCGPKVQEMKLYQSGTKEDADQQLPSNIGYHTFYCMFIFYRLYFYYRPKMLE